MAAKDMLRCMHMCVCVCSTYLSAAPDEICKCQQQQQQHQEQQGVGATKAADIFYSLSTKRITRRQTCKWQQQQQQQQVNAIWACKYFYGHK